VFVSIDFSTFLSASVFPGGFFFPYQLFIPIYVTTVKSVYAHP
jgi:hypothetical protein